MLRRVLPLLVVVSVLALPAVPAQGTGSFSFSTPVSCWVACPGWACEPTDPCDATRAPILTDEAACAPTPVAAPGSYADGVLLVGDAASRLDVAAYAPMGSFVLVLCRASPDATGAYLLASRPSAVCGGASTRVHVCGGLLLPESASASIDASGLRGEAVVVRVYNSFGAIESTASWSQS